ncbi:MAG: phosphoribosylamine--glycine ligase [Chloroflexaceae bacterium]
MKILVLGADGRTHALVWKLFNHSTAEVLVAPGNGGAVQLAAQVDLDPTNVVEVARWAFAERVDLIVPAGSGPLRAGLVDEVVAMHIGVCGPAQRTTLIEGSRCFARAFLERHNLPLPRGRVCQDLATAEKYLASQALPVVIKSDDPDDGATIHTDRYAALEALRAVFAATAGDERRGVVIEEHPTGPLVGFSVLTDGTTALPLLPVRLYEQPGAEPPGPVAPELGAVTGNSTYARKLGAYLYERVALPIISALHKEGLPYWGFLGIDCVIADHGPLVTGLRCSLRDMEAQAVLPRLESDLLPLIEAAIARRLDREPPLVWRDEASVALALVSEGYPHHYSPGASIAGLNEVEEGVLVFHGQTYNPTGLRYTLASRGGLDFLLRGAAPASGITLTGGHAVTVVALGATMAGARGRALLNAERIRFPGRTYCEDVGARESGWV